MHFTLDDLPAADAHDFGDASIQEAHQELVQSMIGQADTQNGAHSGGASVGQQHLHQLDPNVGLPSPGRTLDQRQLPRETYLKTA